MNIRFPAQRDQRYYDAHFRFVRNLIEAAGAAFDLFDDDTGERGCFKMFVDNKPVMVDFSDYGSEYSGPLPTFRMHRSRNELSPTIFPFPPCSFWDWAQYIEFEKSVTYKCSGYVLHNQRAHCNNEQRRHHVRRLVENWADKTPGERLQGVSATGRPLNGAETVYWGVKEKMWSMINQCVVSVHVPGQNNNMLDAAQLQLMGLGCCTISPYLPEVLPFWKKLHGDIHYVRCMDDYSDLHEKINWCVANPKECIQIGKNAKELFKATCAPAAMLAWVKECLG